MTENEIRGTVTEIVAAWLQSADDKIPFGERTEIGEAIIALGVKLAAQVFVDLHRIADAVERERP